MFCTNGSLKMPHGSEISIFYKTKTGGIERKAPIGPTDTTKKYIAIFMEDNVDFEIQIDNTLCKDRIIRTELDLEKDGTGYTVGEGECRRLKTLKSKGQKFHIICRSSFDGKTVISDASNIAGTSFDETSKAISRIKFNVSYSKLSKAQFQIIVEKDKDRFPLTVTRFITLHELKSRIEEVVGFHPVALCFQSVILEGDEDTLEKFGLGKNDEIFILRNYVSIHCRQIDEIIHLSLDQLASNRIEHLKLMINVEKRFPIEKQQLRLSENGDELKDDRTLGDYKIKNASLLQLLLRSEGGGKDGGEAVKRPLCHDNKIPNKKRRSAHEHNQTGEIGVICYGETCHQQFKKDTKYVKDKSIKKISFKIEMRVRRYGSIV